MRAAVRFLVVLLATLACGLALAQETIGWIGADVEDVTRAEANKLGWDSAHGAKVKLVAPSSPAERAGVKSGDIIVTVDRTEVDTAAEFRATMAGKPPGTEVRFRVVSGGRERRVVVTVAVRPTPQAADAAAAPILMLDTGGHMALVNGVAFTPDGKQIVSAGDDKTIRVWDWQAGTTVRTIRGQVGPGSEGQIYAMALSPDGRWLAAGGWMTVPGPRDHVIRLYDFASGKLAGLLEGHSDIVDAVDFSPDGRLLLSGGADQSAIIWDIGKRTVRHRLQGHKAEIYTVGFTPDGQRAVTGSYNTTLKLWSVADGKEIATLKGHKAEVHSLAFSPVDGTMASGDSRGEIRLWDARTGRYLRTLFVQGGEAAVLRFSPDGKRLLSTCGEGDCPALQHVWEMASGRELLSYGKHDNGVFAAAISPDGRLAATAGGSNQEIHVWDLDTGETKKVLVGTGTTRFAAAFSADGQRIAWGNSCCAGEHPSEAKSALEYQLRLPAAGQTLGEPERISPDAAAAFLRARTAHGPYTLAHRKGGGYGYDDAVLDIKKNGRTVAYIERGPMSGYVHRAYAFTPDGQTVVSGGDNGALTAYGLNGRKIGDFVGHEGEIWALTPSPDGRLLVSGSNDQTVRLWNLKTRELLVTLFHGSDGEWVMWTPQGYYTGSPGADKIVGWQINKGPENAAEYVGAEQLRQHLNRPDIVEKAIVLGSAEQAVRQSPGTSFRLADLLSRPVPRFRIVSPAPGSVLQGRRATVRIAIEPTPDAVRLIRVQVNGREVAERTPADDSGGFSAGELTIAVPLAKGGNEVRIALTNAIGENAAALTLTNEGEGDLDKRGTLHILAIGVNDYKGLGRHCGDAGNESCDLTAPGADARAFAEAVEKRLGPAHERVEKRVLINDGKRQDAPTAANIIDAVERLRLSQENDTVALFISGHGLNDGPDYRFLATDAEWSDGALRGSTLVPWQTLQGAIEAAKGRRILFIDTCHSGNAYNQRLGNAAYHANIIAYTSARFDQLAVEDPALGHGLFTYAVVEGLDGKAVAASGSEISTRSLADYVVGRVGALAKALHREQEPQYFRGRDAQDFVLARQ